MSLFARKARKKAGNILFLILLAVVLFAALSYAVTSSMRGGGKNAGAENAQTAAAAFMQFFSDMDTFVSSAQLIDNVKDTEFTFRADVIGSGAPNYLWVNGNLNSWNNNSAGGCSREACRIFKPANPNGIAAQTFEQYADPDYNAAVSANGGLARGGHILASQVSVQNIGTSAPELGIMILGIKADVCNEINRQYGISTNYTNQTGATLEVPATSRPTVLGNPTVFDTTRVWGDEETQFAGKHTFCSVLNNGSATGSDLGIFHVLIER